MRWLEIIELQSVSKDKKPLELVLKGLIEELNKNSDQKLIHIFNHITVPGDFAIHLFHESGKADISGSTLGLQLVSALKQYGLVNHKIWVERFQ